MSREQPPAPPSPHARFHPPPSSGTSNDAAMRIMLPVGRTGLSIVAGYLGLLALFVAPAPLALAFGIWAAVDLKKHPEKSGMGRAIFAIVTGALGSALLAVLVLK
jgi:hypothetical protein